MLGVSSIYCSLGMRRVCLGHNLFRPVFSNGTEHQCIVNIDHSYLAWDCRNTEMSHC